MSRILLVAFAFFLIAAAPAAADRLPGACVTNGLQLDVAWDQSVVRNGDPVHFTVRVRNDDPGVCNVSGATITVQLPGPTGTASGQIVTLASNASYPAGTGLTVVGSVPYTVAVDAGVSAVAMRASATFTVHDGPPDSTGTIQRGLATNVSQPALSLAVTPTPANGPAPLNVTLNYVLANTSSTAVPISNPTISDGGCSPLVRGSGDTNANNLLDTGEGWHYSCAVTFDRPGQSGSTPTAAGTSTVDQRQVLAPAGAWSVTATAPPRPHLTLTKTATPETEIAPFVATYTYSVLNDSDPAARPVSDVTVQDAACAPVTRTSGDAELNRGEVWTFSCSEQILNAGTYTSGAVAYGRDTFDGAQIGSQPASATITAGLAPAVVLPGPTTQSPSPSPTPTPTTVDDDESLTPATTRPSTRVKFSYTGRLRPVTACRGNVTLTLKAGTKKVATKKVRLDRNCRFKVSFDVARSRLNSATRVTVTAKLGKRTATRHLSVPQR